MPALLVITGPTGVGKTDLTIRLAELLDCPVLNADSRQVYREIPIGTAAPTAEEQSRVRHYFVGCKSLAEPYNAGQYEADCLQVIDSLLAARPHHQPRLSSCSNDHLSAPMRIADWYLPASLMQTIHDSDVFAILSGGSMLYIDAVCKGLDDIPSVSHEVRGQVVRDFHANGLEWLQQQVLTCDPAYWDIVDRSNPQRLMHCLEICRMTGKPYSSFRTQSSHVPYSPYMLHASSNVTLEPSHPVSDSLSEHEQPSLLMPTDRPFDVIQLCLSRPRAELYERINRRVDMMMQQGLLAEAESVFHLRHLNSLNTVGYKELFAYMEGHCSLDEAVSLIKQHTRNYAKRQMTWWRNR